MSGENIIAPPSLGTLEQIEKGRDAPDGNTNRGRRQGNQHHYWCFTFNNYGENYNKFLENIKFETSKGVVGKEVCPTTGTPHLQGFVSFIKKKRLTELKKDYHITIHWEPAKASAASNFTYCTKSKDYVEWGLPDRPPRQIQVLETLRGWQEEIYNIYLTEPDDRTIYWFWENNGNIGKSSFIKYMIVKEKVLFCSGGKHADIINLVFNQNMDTCKAVFFDIPRANKGHISYASLECIKNGMICNTKYETGVKVFNSPHIFIFANFPPEKPELLSTDRWHIREL